MKCKLITIGKTKSRPFIDAAADYAQRISHYMPYESLVARDERQALSKIDANDHLVVCEKEGAAYSSEELAEYFDNHRNRGTKRLVFFIGGPSGIGKPILERANEQISLSRMTFPHELAQVILLEQVYRACSILKGEPYHK